MACVKHSVDLIKFTYIETYYVFLFRRRKIVLTEHRPICSKIVCASTVIKKVLSEVQQLMSLSICRLQA